MLYLHAGKNTNLETDTVIGIFDLDAATVSPVTRKFLSAKEKKGDVILIAEELPKSFLLTAENPGDYRMKPGRKKKQKETVYLSQLSPATLVQRIK